nr:MAG TPA: hypothetical protein [Crassvirales sp.]
MMVYPKHSFKKNYLNSQLLNIQSGEICIIRFQILEIILLEMVIILNLMALL